MAGGHRAARQFFRLRGEMQIDEKRGRHPVMPHQIAHQDGKDVVIKYYSGVHYSIITCSDKKQIDAMALFP